jgi:hypothetical protein
MAFNGHEGSREPEFMLRCGSNATACNTRVLDKGIHGADGVYRSVAPLLLFFIDGNNQNLHLFLI